MALEIIFFFLIKNVENKNLYEKLIKSGRFENVWLISKPTANYNYEI